MKEYSDKERRAAAVIQKQFRKYLAVKKTEEEWIAFMREQTPNAVEETM